MNDNGKAKEIFRDVFNLIDSGCNIESFKEQSKKIAPKYTEVKDTMLCVELLTVAASHIVRRDKVI